MPDPLAPHMPLDELARTRDEATRLLERFGVDLQAALMRFEDPAGLTRERRSKLDALLRRLRSGATRYPRTKDYLLELASFVQERFDELAGWAAAAHARRGEVDGRLARAYNRVVGQGLGSLPGTLSSEGRSQVRKGIGDLVERLLPPDLVPAEQRGDFARARAEITSGLQRWAEEQPLLEEAFFQIERVVTEAAYYLHRKVTIHGHLVDLKRLGDEVPALSAEGARAIDQHAGTLGKAWAEADRDADQRVARAGRAGPARRTPTAPRQAACSTVPAPAPREQGFSVQRNASLEPKFVLDPARRFLSELGLDAGIRITRNTVEIKLSSEIVVVDPLFFDERTKTRVAPKLEAQLGPDWKLEAGYSGTHQGGAWSEEAVRATLSGAKGPWSGNVGYSRLDRADPRLEGLIRYQTEALQAGLRYGSRDGGRAHGLGVDATRALGGGASLSAGYSGTLAGGRWTEEQLRLAAALQRGSLQGSVEYQRGAGGYEVKATIEYRF